MKVKPILISVALLLLAILAFKMGRIFLLVRNYENVFTNSEPSDSTVTDVVATTGSDGRPAQLISAFFGLDDAIPNLMKHLIGPEAPGHDGMPVIFSHEIDFDSLQAGDFKVISESGRTVVPLYATLAPADDLGEHRTVLLVGPIGSVEDQPKRVEVAGHVLSKDGSLTFKGTTVDVTPLEAGPTLVMGEIVPEDQWELGKAATLLPWGGGDGCPEGTVGVVRAVWAGGVTLPGRVEVDDRVRQAYQVTVIQEDGTSVDVMAFAIADKGDGDNNHELCLDVDGTPVAIQLPANLVTDPNGDFNPETKIELPKP